MSAEADDLALVDASSRGDRRALARLLTIVETGGERFRAIAPEIAAAGQGVFVVGITGAPGSGKSTLTDGLISELRARNERVAVIAVDPSSPVHGGAILGDRVRLREHHSTDPAVFFRSMASRGHLGGLGAAVPAAIRTLDAAGWPTVIIETVGVGQSEVEIAATADTTIVVVNPGWGDEIQANKAGLLEIADVFIVNKSDRPGAARTVSDLERMLHLGGPRARTPPVVQTIATTQGGIDALCQSIFEHRTYLHESAELDRRRGARRVNEAVDRARTELMAALELACNSPAGRRTLSEVRDGSSDPVQASIELVELVAVSDDSTR